MPINKFTPKNCTRFYREKCDCNKCKDLDSLNTVKNKRKKQLRLNVYGLKFLEGLTPFFITKL